MPIARLLAGKAGLSKAHGHCGAVTLIQRFGSALNLNVHFHMLLPDGLYVDGVTGPRFHPVTAPTSEELQRLVTQISERIGRQLERKGLLVRDSESSHLGLESDSDDALSDLQGHSIRYRIALGPRSEEASEKVAQASGFSLHAGVATGAGQRERLERICRYVSRSAVANERWSLTTQGKVRYALKSAYRDGTTHVIFEPLDFLSRLAALVPKRRVNLTRFHGVFAPPHRLRAWIVPGKGEKDGHLAASAASGGGNRAARMGWA